MSSRSQSRRTAAAATRRESGRCWRGIRRTRGRFYLFLLYEVNRGLIHWAFYPGKGAVYVCRFLRRVRRWYPRRPVRVALDRDSAHPIKAHVTRSLMRRLRPNWTSLPKRSADENPAEAIFSDIRQNILDNSDDPDERTTRGRISRHLRARDRRPDRFVRIGYLRNTHKKIEVAHSGACRTNP